MAATPVIAIFDVGKTNKKLLLFDENYRIVFEKTARFTETADEDGFPCENLESLGKSVYDSLSEVSRLKKFDIKAVNFSAYGASFVYLDQYGTAVTPLYNYLKIYPEKLSDQLYKRYRGEKKFCLQTASPALGALNSGLQIYRLKQEKPEKFSRVKYALHLPQYLSFLLTGQYYSEITSIGCHTALWDFKINAYHDWVKQEGIINKLAPIKPGNTTIQASGYQVGIGMHDSSAALIPYLVNFSEPFMLLSTGTWCISLNPFDHSALTSGELKQDCLQFLDYHGKPVKASRLFSGYEYEQQVQRIANHFKQDAIKYRTLLFDPHVIKQMQKSSPIVDGTFKKVSDFCWRDLSSFKNDVEAYHQLIHDLVRLQYASAQLVLSGTHVKRLFVDGGFSKNSIFMHMLASAFPDMEVYAASMAQASGLGAALAIHKSWSTKPVPNDIIQLQYYSASHTFC